MNKKNLRNSIKSILLHVPTPILKKIVTVRDWFWWQYCRLWESAQSYKKLTSVVETASKKRVLVYALHGMSHAGTEKNLQLIANSLADDYEVFFMYGTKANNEPAAGILDDQVTPIPFTYSSVEIAVPNRIYNMQPILTDVIKHYQIDCLITASPGYSHYPWNQVRDIPIVLSNVFGAPTLQPNIRQTIFMSDTVRVHAQQWTGTNNNHVVRYLSLTKEPLKNHRELGAELRQKLNIPLNDFVFGRIGRDDDGIFDPIGINAWKRIEKKYPNAHFIVMSPPPKLVSIVETEQIPRVYFLPPSGLEKDVWAFHGALDAMAHFRFDGETSGVAIAESLAIGNPIITHESHIWNAHLEYLGEDCARIATRNNPEQYATFMEEFINAKYFHQKKWNDLQESAQQTGDRLFTPSAYATFIKRIIKDIV